MWSAGPMRLRCRLAVALAFCALWALPEVSLAAEKEINVVEDSTNDNGFLTSAAAHFANPIRVKSKAELAQKVGAALGEGDCIKKLTIVGHGAPGDISTGSGQGSESCKYINGNQAEWKPALQGLQGKFCADAKIVLWGCHVGACNKGAEKLHELAKFFGVKVDAQTGAVYGDGTTEPGSETQSADPKSEKPPAHKSAPGPCKKKKPGGTINVREVPVLPASVSFPYLGTFADPQPIPSSEIAAVAFIPSSLLSTLFERGDPERPFTEVATLSPDGQLYVMQNAIANRELVQSIVQGVAADSISDLSELGLKVNAAIVFQLTSGEQVTFFAQGDYQYLLSNNDFRHSLNVTCDGIALYRLLTEKPLPVTIVHAHLPVATENLLLLLAVQAAGLAERGLIADAISTLERLVAETESRSGGEIPSATALQIIAGARDLENCYLPLDGDPPQCTLASRTANGIEVRVQDPGSGLAEIRVVRADNAAVQVPSFPQGSTAAWTVTATKVDPALTSRVDLEVRDRTGNVTRCDPLIALAVREHGRPASVTVSGLAAAEGKVTIINGTPGLTNLEIDVNGARFRIAGLGDGQERTLDISSALRQGDDNVVKMTAFGKPGASATVVIHE